MGCYSWVCNGCGHELKENELCVMDGRTVCYDGYGSGCQDNPSCWHKVCYELSDKKERPSQSASNQGFGHAALAFLPNFDNSAPIQFKVLFCTCNEVGESFVQNDFFVIKNEDFEIQDNREYERKCRLVEDEIANAFMKEHCYADSAYSKLREEIDAIIGMKSPKRNAFVFNDFQKALEVAERLIPSSPNGYDLIVIGVQDRLEGLYFERNVSEKETEVSYSHGILANKTVGNTINQPEITMPPEGTSSGYRQGDGTMWVACNPEPDKKPGIAFCEHPGNWVNPALYTIVAVFEKETDRDFVLNLHKIAVTKGLQ